MATDMPMIQAVVIQDSEGRRIIAKYYNKKQFPSVEVQGEFEVNLFKKTRHHAPKIEAQVVTFERQTAVFKLCGDVTFFVVGSVAENELILTHVLDGLVDAVTGLLKMVPEKRLILSNVELVLLAIDELVDGGIIFEVDPAEIESRVLMRGAVPESMSGYNELTLSSIMATAKDAVGRQLFK